MKSAHVVFEKMHGLGNDFVLIDNRQQSIDMSKEVIRSLANRNTGIGFDQLLLIDETDIEGCDASYRFFNPDGSEAQQCGNGQRCLSHYLHLNSPDQFEFCLVGLAGKIYSKIEHNGQVRVNMGKVQSLETLTIDEKSCFHVLFGNPHLVTRTPSVDDCDLVSMNEQMTEPFVDGINLEVVELVDDLTIKIRVHERGTGETLACGSGACAAAFAMYSAELIGKQVKVMLPGGHLMVEYDEQSENIYLTGAATHVFTGNILL